jgi:hypothetical protein
MNDQPTTPDETPAFAAAGPGPSFDASGESPGARPELLVGAAFVGGLVVAQILRRLGRD